jgi:ABC-type branched-subunit amino acid transport system ATPase component
MKEGLRVDNVSKWFGGVHALEGVTLDFGGCGIIGLIGPNGSGKSTLINVVSGMLKPKAGSILWRGADIAGWNAYRVARAGIARTFQDSMAFPGITVLDNVRIALDGERKARKSASDLLEEHDLGAYALVPAQELPFGVGRRLGIALAMASGPRLLLLDEPAAGLNDQESDVLAQLLQQLRRDDRVIVLVDHDMSFLMPICTRVVVLDSGRVLADGTPAEIQNNKQVVSVYLGSTFAGNL